MSGTTIDKLGWACFDAQKRLLVVRSRGKDVFYIPGGKREAGETDQQAITRGVFEDVSVHLKPETLSLMMIQSEPAHGKEDAIIQVKLYSGDYEGELMAVSEIEEMRFVTYGEKACCSIVTQQIMHELHKSRILSSGRMRDQYDWLLFDADNTLFHFFDQKGLELMFSNLGHDFTPEQYFDYKILNTSLWKDYEAHRITITQLVQNRFKPYEEVTGKTAFDLNTLFMIAMAEVCIPLESAPEIVRVLKVMGFNLGLVSNGFTQLQTVRLDKHGILGCFSFVMASEEAPKGKPHREFFEEAFKRMGDFDPKRVLMIGDSLTSDMAGAREVGIASCWLNHERVKSKSDHQPTFVVHSLSELKALFLGKPPVKEATGSATAIVCMRSAAVVEPRDEENLFDRLF